MIKQDGEHISLEKEKSGQYSRWDKHINVYSIFGKCFKMALIYEVIIDTVLSADPYTLG